jgi:hypothetical protein
MTSAFERFVDALRKAPSRLAFAMIRTERLVIRA